jgi:hypothetical protein
VFSSFSVAILTIGIGLNITVFTVVDALVLRPAPLVEPERLVHLYQDSDSGSPSSTAYPVYRDMAAMTDLFSSVAATTSTTANWDTADGPRQVAIDFATASYFRPSASVLQGRWFDAEARQRRAEMVGQVVTYNAWRSRFAEDPGVVGRTIRLTATSRSRSSAWARAGFRGEAGALSTDFWVSISSVGIGGQYRVANLERRGDHWYTVKARLAPGVGASKRARSATSLAPAMA